MKKSIFLKVCLMVLTLSLSAYAFLYSQESKQQFNDGTYEGKSFKFPGATKLTVTIENGEIVDIKVTKLISPKKYTKMVQPLIDAIIRRRSTEVDAITGATMNSNAIKKAVDDALSKAAVKPTP